MHGKLSAALAMAGVAGVATAAFFACSDPPTTPPSADAGSDARPAELCSPSPAPPSFPNSPCTAPRPADEDAFDEALKNIGRDRCSLQQDPKKMTNAVMDVGDPRKLPDFLPLLEWPLRLPSYGKDTARAFDDALASSRPVSRSLAAASLRRGKPIGGCADPTWFDVASTASTASPLAAALGRLAADDGVDFDVVAAESALTGVPLELQRVLVPIARALDHARLAIAEARAPAAAFLPRVRSAPDWVIGSLTYKWTDPLLAAFDGVDVAKMTEVAAEVAIAIEAGELARFRGAELPDVDLDTPFGPLVLRGAAANTYQPGTIEERATFFLDTGGDDVYRVAVAAANLERPLAVHVDLGGDDRYGYVEKPVAADAAGDRLPSDDAGRSARTLSRVGRQGSGLFGVGLLFDLGGGKDAYRSLAVSQGAGVLGVGVLYDDGGADTYEAEVLAQGAASWGIGLLLDGGGDDRHLAYADAQGFGMVQGFGAAIDRAGDDGWYTNPGYPGVAGIKDDILYANGQLPGKANTSLAQGCGFGHRPDAPEPGFQFAGGFGLLRDAAGNDTYTTGVFGQGCSFGLGIGMLLDGAGDDVYKGLWYVQGANAHTAVAYFHDAAGNDRYNPDGFPVTATSIGVGHDFSVAVHYDEGGDDAYFGPGLSLGSGNANGIGVMVVRGGTDAFTAANVVSLGAANATEIFGTSRRNLPTIGVFVKAGGPATYAVAGSTPVRTKMVHGRSARTTATAGSTGARPTISRRAWGSTAPEGPRSSRESALLGLRRERERGVGILLVLCRGDRLEAAVAREQRDRPGEHGPHHLHQEEQARVGGAALLHDALGVEERHPAEEPGLKDAEQARRAGDEDGDAEHAHHRGGLPEGGRAAVGVLEPGAPREEPHPGGVDRPVERGLEQVAARVLR